MALESKVEDTEFQAVVFVTGSSSLLHPLTSDPATLPKALLPVAGVPLLAYQLLLLSKAGFSGTETPSTHCVHWCALVCTGVRWCALECAGGHCVHPLQLFDVSHCLLVPPVLRVADALVFVPQGSVACVRDFLATRTCVL